MMTTHKACHGCLDGCTQDEPKHCVSCIHEAWPCDAQRLRGLLVDAASVAHTASKHPPYGSSFLDCSWTSCQSYRDAIGRPAAPSASTEEATGRGVSIEGPCSSATSASG